MESPPRSGYLLRLYHSNADAPDGVSIQARVASAQGSLAPSTPQAITTPSLVILLAQLLRGGIAIRTDDGPKSISGILVPVCLKTIVGSDYCASPE